MRLLAVLLSYLVFFLALPFLLTHPKLRHGIAARLGFYPRDWPRLVPGPRLLLHGASAGDVLALIPLAREIKARRPDVQLVISTITNSGRAMAERHQGLFGAITYLAYDLPGAVARMLRRVRPNLIVLEYTELWPRLIRSARKRGIKLVLHNGRLSDARLGRYRWLFSLTGNLLLAFELLLMRDDDEAEAARRLGARELQIRVTGNTKFDNLDVEPNPATVAQVRAATAWPSDAPVWVAGSTHEGEEEALLDLFVALQRTTPALRMIVAPRYTERAERVMTLAVRRGLKARLRSKSGGSPDVLVLDTIGELAASYELGALVFVGGSFVPRGGQNILEPAARGKPVLFGPYMHNFADSVQVLLGRGGIQVASPTQLQRVLADLLAHPEHAQELGAMARDQVMAVRGAAAKNAGLIVELLKR
ncbi:MAG: 3-deoxy-D-manno-octulosonic acid transferase [Deltaproteobacteria bacterium]|nr:3-deoxy-D-manno-octulosonic acid transferase [Deltaproteobacteria bacterium]